MEDQHVLKQRYLAVVAPALLCLITGIQIYLVRTQGLSPWKGGGWGMFSTVEAPSARFLRIYLVTEQGEISVLAPESLRGQELEVQTLPNSRRLERFATTLAQATWVPYRFVPAVMRYQQLINDADGNISPDNGGAVPAAVDICRAPAKYSPSASLISC